MAKSFSMGRLLPKCLVTLSLPKVNGKFHSTACVQFDWYAVNGTCVRAWVSVVSFNVPM